MGEDSDRFVNGAVQLNKGYSRLNLVSSMQLYRNSRVILCFAIGIVMVSISGLAQPVFAPPHPQSDQTTATEAQPDQIHLPGSANELVREVMRNEMKQNDSQDRFFYRVRKETPSGSQTKDMVDTSEGSIGRLVAVDNRLPTSEERQKDQDRLQKLLNDPAAQKKHRKSQMEDDQRVSNILNAMPDAFIYQYDGAEDSKYGKLVRLRFKPNPNFNPPSRETQILRGMEGIMLIAAEPKRLVKIAATLTHEVSFGWGIFGHLDKGGHFIVEQSQVGNNNDWETTHMDLDFTGRVLLFKKLNIKEDDTTSDFRLAPRNLTLAQGLELLNKQNSVMAQRNAQGPSTNK